jgi:hypothetical protein
MGTFDALKNEHRFSKNRKLERAKRSCLGKIKHKSRLSAEYVLDRMNGRDSHLLEIYQCKVCKFFHIGHSQKKDK